MRLLLSHLILLAALPLHADEWWTWSMFDLHRKPPWTAGVFVGNRADAEDGSHVQIVSPRLKYAAAPWLDVGFGLSALSIENAVTNLRYEQFRPELELNPKMDLTDHLRLEWRNRMEWRWNEGETFTTHRSRHRMQIGWTLPQRVAPLTRVFASNEWLVDLHRRQWTENRLVPLGLTFKLSSSVDLDVFYMIDSTQVMAAWKHESVFGTYLRARF